MIKTLSKLGTEVYFLNSIKTIQLITTYIIFVNSEKFCTFPLKSYTWQECPLSLFFAMLY